MSSSAALCDKLTARIETAVAMGKSAREIAHNIMPIVLAYEARARADERAKVAADIEREADKCDENPRYGGMMAAADIARGDA